MPKEVLFEIGAEEIPALFVRQAIPEMERLVEERLAGVRLDHGRITAWGTPRRLGLRIEDVEEKQPDRVIEIAGPPVRVSYDEQGKPTKAAEGFAKRNGVAVGDLGVISREKGDYLCVKQLDEGKLAESLLPGLLTDITLSIPFRKSMRWGTGETRFARPIHWIVALFGSEVIDLEVGGIRSGDQTRGHRFVSPGPLKVDAYSSYVESLRDASVLIDPDERRRVIWEGVETAAISVGGRGRTDEGLLDEVTFLTECPVVLLGRFDEEFLALPAEVLVAAMREHQRYFSVEVPEDSGGLMAHFIVVSNTPSADADIVVRGNERVLRARLADARFFFDADRARPLASRVEALKGVVFQQRLGTSYDKVLRFKAIAEWLAEGHAPHVKEAVSRAAFLCKADLLSEMVGEFPSLQGTVGRIYALLDGETEEVAEAIYSHYLPLGGGGELAESDAGAIVGIADKIDTVVGYFAIGDVPTGTTDPFALRRRTLGIIRTVLSREYRVSMRGLIGKSIETLEGTVEMEQETVGEAVLEFIRLRLQNLLLSEGYAHDVVDAILSIQDDDVVDARQRMQPLTAARELPDFKDAAVAFKRVGNIIRDQQGGTIDPERFENDAERELHEATKKVKDEVERLVGERRYADVFGILSQLRPHIDLFFEEVMVMAEDEGVRGNRISLLHEVYRLFSRIADFSKINTE